MSQNMTWIQREMKQDEAEQNWESHEIFRILYWNTVCHLQFVLIKDKKEAQEDCWEIFTTNNENALQILWKITQEFSKQHKQAVLLIYKYLSLHTHFIKWQNQVILIYNWADDEYSSIKTNDKQTDSSKRYN